MRGKLISGAYIAAVMLIAAPVFAQSGTDSRQPPQGGNQPPSGTNRDRNQNRDRDPSNLDQNRGTTDGQQFSMARSSKVIGSSIRDAQGKEIGRIQDLGVDPQTGRIAYAVTTLNASGAGTGTTGVGRSYAVPYRTLQTDQSGNFTLDSSAVTTMQQDQGFDANTFPDMSDRQWAERTHTRYGQQPYYQGQTGGDRQLRIMRLSQLNGTTLNDSANQRMGTVRDVMIDTRQGRVRSVVGDFGSSVPSMNNKLTSVPFSSFSENETDRSNPRRTSYLTVNADRTMLESAPTFTDSEWPRDNDREYYQKVNRHYKINDRDLDVDRGRDNDRDGDRDRDINPDINRDRDGDRDRDGGSEKDSDGKP